MNSKTGFFSVIIFTASLLTHTIHAQDGVFDNLEVNDRAGVGHPVSDEDRMIIYRESYDYGPDRSGLYSLRSGTYGKENGGSNWSVTGVDAAIKGYSYWGNQHTAGLAAYSYLDYSNSAALAAGSFDASVLALLGYRDGEGKYWSGFFSHDVYVRDNVLLGNNTPGQQWILHATTNHNPPAQYLEISFDNDYGDFQWGEGMTITREGTVGIGTKPPPGSDDRLCVNGNTRIKGTMYAQEVNVTLEGYWPDYVFQSNYELQSLMSVEEHIAQNGCLPGIPSQDEIRENGISLGRMQAKLLEKIEELTLHIIEQNKRISRLDSENKALMERMNAIAGHNHY